MQNLGKGIESMARRPGSSAEEALALLVDDLLGLGDGKGHRLVLAGMRFGTHEAVLLRPGLEILLDDTGGLKAAPCRIRLRTDAKALVFDGLGGGLRLLARAAAS